MSKTKRNLTALKKEENESFMECVDQWFVDGPPSIPFDISDPDHDLLNFLREEVQKAGGKVSDVKSLPKIAQKAWDDVLVKMRDEDLWEKIDDLRTFYELAAKRFFKYKIGKDGYVNVVFV
jgi:hypothetical protein